MSEFSKEKIRYKNFYTRIKKIMFFYDKCFLHSYFFKVYIRKIDNCQNICFDAVVKFLLFDKRKNKKKYVKEDHLHYVSYWCQKNRKGIEFFLRKFAYNICIIYIYIQIWRCIFKKNAYAMYIRSSTCPFRDLSCTHLLFP